MTRTTQEVCEVIANSTDEERRLIIRRILDLPGLTDEQRRKVRFVMLLGMAGGRSTKQ